MMKLNRRAWLTVFLAVFGLASTSFHAQAQLLAPVTVTIDAPAPGATVGGTIEVRARTTGLGSPFVVGVQFKLDGANLGAEDQSSPYSTSWNTASVGNGWHTLRAVARDGLGIQYTSDPVTVRVFNAPPPPPSAGRYEQTHATVSYTGSWTQGDASRAWSAGSAATSGVAGARASFTFTGSSVTWIGGRTPATGIARVYLDGMYAADVDTHSLTEEIRVTMFSLTGLANTTHTLTIEATGQQNPNSTSPVIVVDAFDVPAPAILRLQETDPNVAYGVGWTQGNPIRAWSAGAAAIAATAGAQATLTFTGTAVSWVGARGNQCGIARVYLDGNLVATIDTYAAVEEIQAALYTVTGLADAPHTLTIESTGTQNPASSASLVIIDAFDVTQTGVQVQESDPRISYGAGWVQNIRDHAYTQGVTAESNTIGAQATFTFTGTGITWISARGPQTGMVRVYLDGVYQGEIDTYATSEGPQHPLYTARGLAPGSHTLRVEVSGRNPVSRDAWILIDAFHVNP